MTTLREHPATIRTRQLVRAKSCLCRSKGGTLGDYTDPYTLGMGAASSGSSPWANPAYEGGYSTASNAPASSGQTDAGGFNLNNFLSNAASVIGTAGGAFINAAGRPTGVPASAAAAHPNSQAASFNTSGAIADIFKWFGYGTGSTPTVGTPPPITPQPGTGTRPPAAGIVPGVSNTTLIIGAGVVLAAVLLLRRR